MAFRNKAEKDNWYMFLCADMSVPTRNFIRSPAALVYHKNSILGIFSYSTERLIDEHRTHSKKRKYITKHIKTIKFKTKTIYLIFLKNDVNFTEKIKVFLYKIFVQLQIFVRI